MGKTVSELNAIDAERDRLAEIERMEPINAASSAQLALDGGVITDKMVDAALKDNEHGAENLGGILNRYQMDDWVDRYLPMIREEADNILTGANIEKAVGMADSSVTQSFKNSREAMGQRMTGMGIDQTQAQIDQQNKSSGLSEVGQLVDKRNDARVSATDRDNAIMAGGMGSIDTARDE